MVELKPENIVFTKYLDTDIDSICVFFSRNNTAHLVGEYNVPESYNYMVLYAAREGEEIPDYVEIVNYNELKEYIDKDSECLPDMRFDFQEEKFISLIDFFKNYILNNQAS